jgi:hypothetical protein
MGHKNNMTQSALNVNLIPVRDIAIPPSGFAAFKVGRRASMSALMDALKSKSHIAIFTQINPDNDGPQIADLHPIGTLCEIVQHKERDDNTIKIIVRGLKRIQIAKVMKSSPHLVIEPIEVSDIKPVGGIKLPPKKHMKDAVSLLLKYKPDLPLRPPVTIPFDASPGALADFLLPRISGNYENQLVGLLELDPRRRLKFAYEVLVKEGETAKLESEINDQVTAAIKDEHREIYLRGRLKVILEQLGENAPLSLYNPIFRGKSFKPNPNLVFVLMPFAEEFRPIYNEIIKPVVERFGLTSIRADDLYGTKAIIEDIWKLINEAKIIIADATGKNPNVFYEIGLAHAVGKEVIIISQMIEDVPFDLRHLRCFIYKDSVAGFRKLERQLQQTLSTIEGLSQPEPES